MDNWFGIDANEQPMLGLSSAEKKHKLFLDQKRPKRHPQGFCRHTRMGRVELRISFFYRIPGYRFCFLYPAVLRVHLQPYRLVEIVKAHLLILVEFIHEISMTGARFFLENRDLLCT